jgi:hypothetical protein
MAGRAATDDPDVVVTVTRSAGRDGAVLVMIDTSFEPDGRDGGPRLRVRINDDPVWVGVASQPVGDAKQVQADSRTLTVRLAELVRVPTSSPAASARTQRSHRPMPDTTNLQLTVRAAPPEQHQAILKVINAYGLGQDWDSAPDEGYAELELGVQYTDSQGVVGHADQIAAELIAAAPGASFIVWEDPAYEWLGVVSVYTPELGLFEADCDADGIPQFSSQAILAFLDRVEQTTPQATVADVRAAIERATGKPWFDALQADSTAEPGGDDG